MLPRRRKDRYTRFEWICAHRGRVDEAADHGREDELASQSGMLPGRLHAGHVGGGRGGVRLGPAVHGSLPHAVRAPSGRTPTLAVMIVPCVTLPVDLPARQI